MTDNTKNFTSRSEHEVEEKLINTLQEDGYIYRKDIKDKESMDKNFKEKFEELNKTVLQGKKLSDSEFNRLMKSITQTNDTFECSKMLREKITLQLDEPINNNYNVLCSLVDTTDWCKNEYEVTNQIRINTDNSFNVYDVVILINGLPLVHIELKKSDVNHRNALKQIHKYKKKDSLFFHTLFCFTQLFIVSNETKTCYFTNNNSNFFKFDEKEQFLPVYTYADENNRKIVNLYEFAKTFLQKCRLGKMIGKYMVLVQTERRVLIMRPYQIYAVEKIMKAVEDNKGNGYIWHTTGSGKTLTSFKAATLLKHNDNISKCLFVVDRKDLDRQTRDEFNKFQEGCVEENTNTKQLVTRLKSKNKEDKIIVTTIQKLGIALSQAEGKASYRKELQQLSKERIVFIFDECHRSQFGENHRAIVDFFPKAQLFGFTGTPIFDENATQNFVINNIKDNKHEKKNFTTKDIFHNELHKYTITNAIADQNVLQFQVGYLKTTNTPVNKPTSRENKIAIINAIIANHDKLTKDGLFNALFATSSINDAVEYYKLFKEIQTKNAENNPNYSPLKIACVFSPPPQLVQNSADMKQMQEDLQQEVEDNKENPNEKYIALKEIIDDYNSKYGTEHDVNEFDLYYSDLQKRVKEQKKILETENKKQFVDITIVVDMLLTGFDSKYLNTLYVDKNLKHHRLIQAFSRTNRVLNSNKPFGNIYDFRWQEREVDEAVALFSGEKIEVAREIWIVDPPAKVIEELSEINECRNRFFKERGLDPAASDSPYQLKGNDEIREYLEIEKERIKKRYEIEQYIDITTEEKAEADAILSMDVINSVKRVYLETAKRIIKDTTNANTDSKDIEGYEEVTVEQLALELEYAVFANARISYDYIMKLISQITKKERDDITIEQLIELMLSIPEFHRFKDEIVDFLRNFKYDRGYEESELCDIVRDYIMNLFQSQIKAFAEEYKVSYGEFKALVDEILERGTINYSSFDSDLKQLFKNAGYTGIKLWKPKKELMEKLHPYLVKINNGDISGYELLLQSGKK